MAYKKLTVGDLQDLLSLLLADKQITKKTEVWLSSDEEGNDYAPLIQAEDGAYNIGTYPDRSKLILYPISM